VRKGTSHTEEARQKISEKAAGKPKSIETRERMQAAALVRWAKRRQEAKASSCTLVANENERVAMEQLAYQPRAVSDTYEVPRQQGEA